MDSWNKDVKSILAAVAVSLLFAVGVVWFIYAVL